MPSWGAVAYGVVLSGLLAAVAVVVLLRERRRSVLLTAALATAAAPLAWDLILRHTGGDFFVDAPIAVFPISYEDTGPASSLPPSPRSCSASAHSRTQAADAWL